MSQGKIREESKVVLSCQSHSSSELSENSLKLLPPPRAPIFGFTGLKRAFSPGVGIGQAQAERRPSCLLLSPKQAKLLARQKGLLNGLG